MKKHAAAFVFDERIFVNNIKNFTLLSLYLTLNRQCSKPPQFALCPPRENVFLLNKAYHIACFHRLQDWLLKSHRILTRVCKDHRVSLVFLVAMDITGYQAAMVEMEQKVIKAWLVLLDHVVRKETQGKMAQTLTTETGNNVRGGVKTAVTLVL